MAEQFLNTDKKQKPPKGIKLLGGFISAPSEYRLPITPSRRLKVRLFNA